MKLIIIILLLFINYYDDEILCFIILCCGRIKMVVINRNFVPCPSDSLLPGLRNMFHLRASDSGTIQFVERGRGRRTTARKICTRRKRRDPLVPMG